MKSTYNRTMIYSNEDLQNAETVINLKTGATKYQKGGERKQLSFKGLTRWDIIEGGQEAENIEKNLEADEIDDYHEYLILHFNDGTQTMFGNSYAAMFIR